MTVMVTRQVDGPNIWRQTNETNFVAGEACLWWRCVATIGVWSDRSRASRVTATIHHVRVARLQTAASLGCSLAAAPSTTTDHDDGWGFDWWRRLTLSPNSLNFVPRAHQSTFLRSCVKLYLPQSSSSFLFWFRSQFFVTFFPRNSAFICTYIWIYKVCEKCVWFVCFHVAIFCDLAPVNSICRAGISTNQKTCCCYKKGMNRWRKHERQPSIREYQEGRHSNRCWVELSWAWETVA